MLLYGMIDAHVGPAMSTSDDSGRSEWPCLASSVHAVGRRHNFSLSDYPFVCLHLSGLVAYVGAIVRRHEAEEKLGVVKGHPPDLS